MSRRFGVWLMTIILVGVLASGVLAALTRGEPYDMQSLRLVREALDQHALGVYTFFARHGLFRWPYPPAFFPWVYAAGWLASHGGPSFEFLIRVPSILADGAMAWVVQDQLGRSRRGPRIRLAAAGLVSLGPAFVVIAGYHGQFDALAILPGALAVVLWSRDEIPSRALVCGLLIGLGGALKTVPLLLVLALLPTARSRREVITLLAAAALPVLLAFAPFAVAGTLPSARILQYRGLPGVGDLSLVVQPDLAKLTLGIGNPGASRLTTLLANHGSWLVVIGLLTVAAVGARTRASAIQLSALLWLAVYAFGVNFFFQYLVWGLPFFLMAGYVRTVLVAQLVLLGPALLYYLGPWHSVTLAVLYAVVMIAAWAWATGGFCVLAGRLAVVARAPS